MTVLFDHPDDLSALAQYASELQTIPELAPVLFHNPRAVAGLMRALGGVTDRKALELMASDPDTSLEALAYLAGAFPEAFCANPVCTLLLLERPSLPAEMEPTSLGRLLAFAGMPADFVAAVAAYGPPDMAAAARMHIALAGEAGPDWRQELDAAVAAIPTLPADDLLSVLLRLGLVPDWLVARVDMALAQPAAEPDETAVAAPPPTERELQAADPTLALEELLALADDEEARVRAAVVSNPRLGPEQLAELKRREDGLDNDPLVYRALAANQRTPPEVLRELTANRSALFTGARRAVALNPQAPPEALELLADEPYASDIRLILASHPRLGADQRARMEQASIEAAISSGDPIYRAIGLSHPLAPADALAATARSPQWIERLALVFNPAAPAETLTHLAEDGHRLVRAAARQRMPSSDRSVVE